jgi:hypothetical protein
MDVKTLLDMDTDWLDDLWLDDDNCVASGRGDACRTLADFDASPDNMDEHGANAELVLAARGAFGLLVHAATGDLRDEAWRKDVREAAEALPHLLAAATKGKWTFHPRSRNVLSETIGLLGVHTLTGVCDIVDDSGEGDRFGSFVASAPALVSAVTAIGEGLKDGTGASLIRDTALHSLICVAIGDRRAREAKQEGAPGAGPS